MARFLSRLALAGVLGLLLVGGSQAATFTLTHNGWTYTEDIGSQGLGGFVDPNGVDHMNQNWWWFRTSAMQNEKPLSTLVTGAGIELIGTNGARLRFVESGLFFELQYTLTGISPTLAKVDIDWSVKSVGPNLGVSFFAYTDFDLNNTVNEGTGVLVNPQTVRYVDGTTAADVIASQTDLVGYEVAGWPGLRDLLNDGAVYNVSNSGLPFGPGDMTSVFQWSGSVSQGAPLSGTLTKVIDLAYNPPPPGPVIPEPGTWALMLSGLMPVALRLRKKA
ncbi:MAG: hypothetical protein KatS3mg023_0542 [Armatimonadota bacterium]|nr:MAG: hypothetical protein KatS3mg023_0542 [Armatimonadota bacterium]